MIARGFLGHNPFEVWGDGTQVQAHHRLYYATRDKEEVKLIFSRMLTER